MATAAPSDIWSQCQGILVDCRTANFPESCYGRMRLCGEHVASELLERIARCCSLGLYWACCPVRVVGEFWWALLQSHKTIDSTTNSGVVRRKEPRNLKTGRRLRWPPKPDACMDSSDDSSNPLKIQPVCRLTTFRSKSMATDPKKSVTPTRGCMA